MKSPLLISLIFCFTMPLLAASRPYHLQLEANPAAPFPFLSKFGTVTLDVYPGGVRAETLWLNAFSRDGSSTFTVMNPLGRMYTDIPVSDISSLVKKIAPYKTDIGAAAQLARPISGKVHGLDAKRYRVVYGPAAWIDVWTADSLPDNPQLRTIVREFTRGISPRAAALISALPGIPLYVEINFSHYQKIPILRLKAISYENSGETDALRTGPIYMKAPMLDALWK